METKQRAAATIGAIFDGRLLEMTFGKIGKYLTFIPKWPWQIAILPWQATILPWQITNLPWIIMVKKAILLSWFNVHSKLLPSKLAPIVAAARCFASRNGDAAATADSGTGHDTRTCHRLQIKKADENGFHPPGMLLLYRGNFLGDYRMRVTAPCLVIFSPDFRMALSCQM